MKWWKDNPVTGSWNYCIQCCNDYSIILYNIEMNVLPITDTHLNNLLRLAFILYPPWSWKWGVLRNKCWCSTKAPTHILLWTVHLASSSVFVETYGTHTLLGTVLRLFIPASVQLYMDKPICDLQQVLWECHLLTNGSLGNITPLNRINQSQALKFVANEQSGGREQRRRRTDQLLTFPSSSTTLLEPIRNWRSETHKHAL